MNNTNFKPSPYGGVGGGSGVVHYLPRGLRNNNPLNIIRNGTKWQGMCDTQTDKRFVQFKTLAYGYRAAYKLIHTYMTKYGLLSIEGIITRWAPPSENNTEAYILGVAKRTGWKRNAILSFYDRELMAKLVVAMAEVENGCPVEKGNAVYEGYALAAGWRK